MTGTNFTKLHILTLLSILHLGTAYSCSMYKITVDGKTMVGNNEDSWGQDAKIWFEPATENKYGIACVGYGRNFPEPDGAMNDHGLAYDAFTMYHKPSMPPRDPNKRDFGYRHVKEIMQKCKSVDEAYAFLDTLNLHVLNGSPIFHGGMLLFVDKTGRYLVVEADNMTLGNEATYLLANFSVADTKDLSTIKMARYCKGVEFLKDKQASTNVAFCTALSDTMSANRAKIGDGTLYTSIYDLQEGLIHLTFFHDFSKQLTFNLQDELAKGKHSYDFTELFPNNKGYQRFLNYKTPQNTKFIFKYLVVCGLLFFITSGFYLLSFFKSSRADEPSKYGFLKLGVSALSFSLFVYVFILLRNQGIFFFPSPYDDGSLLKLLASYLPIMLLLLILPLIFVLVRIWRQKRWSGFATWLLGLNCLVYLTLLGLFGYWQLFDVF